MRWSAPVGGCGSHRRSGLASFDRLERQIPVTKLVHVFQFGVVLIVVPFLVGNEIVAGTRRLAVVNIFLHNIGLYIIYLSSQTGNRNTRE